MISAIPKYFSAQYAMIRQKASPAIVIRRECGYLWSTFLKILYAKNPPTIEIHVKRTVLQTTVMGLAAES